MEEQKLQREFFNAHIPIFYLKNMDFSNINFLNQDQIIKIKEKIWKEESSFIDISIKPFLLPNLDNSHYINYSPFQYCKKIIFSSLKSITISAIEIHLENINNPKKIYQLKNQMEPKFQENKSFLNEKFYLKLDYNLSFFKNKRI